MDAEYNIYESTELTQILPVDAARLDGYLKAKAEDAKAAHDELVRDMAEWEDKYREAEKG